MQRTAYAPAAMVFRASECAERVVVLLPRAVAEEQRGVAARAVQRCAAMHRSKGWQRALARAQRLASTCWTTRCACSTRAA